MAFIEKKKNLHRTLYFDDRILSFHFSVSIHDAIVTIDQTRSE